MKALAACCFGFLLHNASIASGLSDLRAQHIVADANAAGDIAGEIRGEDGKRQAVLLRQGRLIELGQGESFATAINDEGAVIGGARDSSNAWRAFIYRQNHGMRDLGTLGGRSSHALALNRSGQVVGYADVNGPDFHAFVFDGSQMKDLGTFGGRSSYATAINAQGQVVGAAQKADGYRRAFLYSPESGMRELPTLGGSVNAAMAINDHGVVVGGSETADRRWHAFIYDGRNMVDLGARIANGNSYATSINNSGTVVGIVRTGMYSNPTFVYEKGQLRILTNLNDLQLTARITDDGEIIGSARSGRRFETVSVRTRAPAGNSWTMADWLTFYAVLPLLLWIGWHLWRDVRAWVRSPRPA